jgi:hypothetical protein
MALDSKKSAWGTWPQGPLRTKKLRGLLSVRKIARLVYLKMVFSAKSGPGCMGDALLASWSSATALSLALDSAKLRAVCVQDTYQI